MASMPPNAIRLFGEQLTPVVSRWLLQGASPVHKPADVAQFTLIEAGDAHHTHLEWLTWRRWFDEHGLQKLQPKVAGMAGAQMISFALPSLPGSTGGPAVQFVITTTAAAVVHFSHLNLKKTSQTKNA